MATVGSPAPVVVTGELLDGRYRIGEAIGHGAMSDVYRARDERLDRTVAVKVLRAGSTDPERFRAETTLLCGLDHPHLVRLHDAGEHQGVPYLVLNLVDGTLAQRLASGALAAETVARIGREIASALDHLHRRGVVHRDIKPSNILLREDGAACLADLGAALSLDGPRRTATGLTIGTPMYLAPEQAAGEQVGPPVDVYSLGLVLLEAATGAPVSGGTPQEVLAARLIRSPVVPATVPAELATVLEGMVALDPGLRPSAAEVAARLERIAEPASPQASTDDLGDTVVMGPPTMVLPVGARPAAAESAGFVAALEAAGHRVRGWLERDRSRRIWLGLGALLVAALLVGRAARDERSWPADLEPAAVATTSLPPTTTTTTVTTPASVAPAPQVGTGCRTDCGPRAEREKPGGEKGGKKG